MTSQHRGLLVTSSPRSDSLLISSLNSDKRFCQAHLELRFRVCSSYRKRYKPLENIQCIPPIFFSITESHINAIYETLFEIWYYLYNLKNVKNTLGGMLLLVKLQAKAYKTQQSNYRMLLTLIKVFVLTWSGLETFA